MDLFGDLGASIVEEDIDACHKVPTRREDKIKPVVIKFVSRKKKNQVLKAAKDNRTILKEKKIFINEHLSPYNKFLFSNAKKLQHTIDNPTGVYKYVWHKGGKIFLRKVDEGSVTSIKCVGDLWRLGLDVTEPDL